MAGVATGDPHIERLDGQKFDLHGLPRHTYNLLTHGELAVYAALGVAPGGATFIHWLEMRMPAGASVLQDEAGLRRVATAEGYTVDTWWDTVPGGPLAGIPHLNVFVLGHPAELEGATGLLIDGTAESDPALYLVRGAPPEPAHD